MTRHSDFKARGGRHELIAICYFYGRDEYAVSLDVDLDPGSVDYEMLLKIQVTIEANISIGSTETNILIHTEVGYYCCRLKTGY